ncbi:MAG: bifunctional adenosylcobinamide kinase/adenosylcobinamide-phosphate guanylyltransferase [Pseudomonadota bacterium]|nr:bifunctional adenosylcobinamide kinase/adenosylcobinamide-phosphate guanylyltransferase [Pseudomonadota bacterium]
MTTTLVLGGARSGKSGHAEALAFASGRDVVYIATANAGARDSEMADRIAHHRASRPVHWTTVEEPISVGAAIARASTPDCVVLVDCLTLWLSNLLFSSAGTYPDTGVITLPPLFYQERAALLTALASASGDVILVSNEVGMGIVPMGAVTRAFVDEQGRLNQAVAATCDRALFIAAGLPLVLKGAPC